MVEQRGDIRRIDVTCPARKARGEKQVEQINFSRTSVDQVWCDRDGCMAYLEVELISDRYIPGPLEVLVSTDKPIMIELCSLDSKKVSYTTKTEN